MTEQLSVSKGVKGIFYLLMLTAIGLSAYYGITQLPLNATIGVTFITMASLILIAGATLIVVCLRYEN